MPRRKQSARFAAQSSVNAGDLSWFTLLYQVSRWTYVGATVGGFALGFLTIMLQAILPASFSPFRDAVLFTLVIALLLVRPQGLLPGRASVERV